MKKLKLTGNKQIDSLAMLAFENNIKSIDEILTDNLDEYLTMKNGSVNHLAYKILKDTVNRYLPSLHYVEGSSDVELRARLDEGSTGFIKRHYSYYNNLFHNCNDSKVKDALKMLETANLIVRHHKLVKHNDGTIERELYIELNILRIAEISELKTERQKTPYIPYVCEADFNSAILLHIHKYIVPSKSLSVCEAQDKPANVVKKVKEKIRNVRKKNTATAIDFNEARLDEKIERELDDKEISTGVSIDTKANNIEDVVKYMFDWNCYLDNKLSHRLSEEELKIYPVIVKLIVRDLTSSYDRLYFGKRKIRLKTEYCNRINELYRKLNGNMLEFVKRICDKFATCSTYRSFEGLIRTIIESISDSLRYELTSYKSVDYDSTYKSKSLIKKTYYNSYSQTTYTDEELTELELRLLAR